MRIGGHLVDDVDSHMTRIDMRRMSYVQRMSKLLAGRLWENAGKPEVDPDRFAVIIGTGLGGGEKIVETYDAMNEGGIRKVSPLAVQMIMPNGAAAVAGLELGARAGVVPGDPRPRGDDDAVPDRQRHRVGVGLDDALRGLHPAPVRGP